MLKLTSQLIISKPVCTCVLLNPKPQGSDDWLLLLFNVLPPLVNWPMSTPPLQKRGQATGKPLSGSEGITAHTANFSSTATLTPIQKETLISNQTMPLKFGSRWPGWFLSFRKSTHICTPIYIIFLFLHLNIKILLCVINGGSSNENFFS